MNNYCEIIFFKTLVLRISNNQLGQLGCPNTTDLSSIILYLKTAKPREDDIFGVCEKYY